MVNRNSRLMGILVLILSLFAYIGAKAQDVVLRGQQFVEQYDSTRVAGITKTQYTYTDKNGIVDTVYLSKNGSAFIWKVSKKTGKKYRKYLPKVTEVLGTKRN